MAETTNSTIIWPLSQLYKVPPKLIAIIPATKALELNKAPIQSIWRTRDKIRVFGWGLY
jgi:hypothetical protein